MADDPIIVKPGAQDFTQVSLATDKPLTMTYDGERVILTYDAGTIRVVLRGFEPDMNPTDPPDEYAYKPRPSVAEVIFFVSP